MYRSTTVLLCVFASVYSLPEYFETLKSAANLVTYSRDLDNSIKWKELKMSELNIDATYHSSKTLSRLHKIRNQLNDASDSYFESSNIIYDWTSLAQSNLKLFLRLLQQHNTTESTFIRKVLDEGLIKFQKSSSLLKAVKQNFSSAQMECLEIRSFFTIEELEKSERFVEKVSSIRRQGHGGTAALAIATGYIGAVIGSFIFPGVGTGVGFLIGAGTTEAVGAPVTELVFVKDVKKQLEQTRDYFSQISNKIGEINTKLDNIIENDDREIKRIIDLGNNAQLTNTALALDIEMAREVIIDVINDLIDECKKYIDAHTS